MRVTRVGGQIVLRDRPGPFWMLGLMLLTGGAFAIAMPLGLAADAGEIEPWARVASLIIGLANCAGAIWWLNRSLASRAEFDLTRRRLTLVRVGLPGRRVVQVELADIVGVEAERGSDSDGGVIWKPVLRLRSGERVNLSELWNHDEQEVKRAVGMVAEVCRLALLVALLLLPAARAEAQSPDPLPFRSSQFGRVTDSAAAGWPASHRSASGDVDFPVQVLYCPQPRYPSELAAFGYDGEVDLQFVIDTTGLAELDQLLVLRASHPGFVLPARRAMAKCRYRPAQKAGQPVRFLVRQRIRYHLQNPDLDQ